MSSLNFEGKSIQEAAHGIAVAKKACSLCKVITRKVLIFKCQCAFCPECLKGKLTKGNVNVLCNTFEAVRKQEAMCVCPNHGYPVNINVIESIIGNRLLEYYSIEALKRQRKICM